MQDPELPKCDFGDPKSVVCAFIISMNSWERLAWQLSRQSADGTAWPEITRTQELVFGRYCTPKERKYGRLGSFGRPPEYDPDREIVVDVIQDGPSRTFVETEREAVLGGGRYRYVLQRQNDRWLIDNLKFRDRDKWTAAIL